MLVKTADDSILNAIQHGVQGNGLLPLYQARDEHNTKLLHALDRQPGWFGRRWSNLKTAGRGIAETTAQLAQSPVGVHGSLAVLQGMLHGRLQHWHVVPSLVLRRLLALRASQEPIQ